MSDLEHVARTYASAPPWGQEILAAVKAGDEPRVWELIDAWIEADPGACQEWRNSYVQAEAMFRMREDRP